MPTGRESQVVEWYDTTDCPGCGGKLAAPHVHVGWLSCNCAGSDGHRTRTCRGCGTTVFEPAHDGPAVISPNTDYFQATSPEIMSTATERAPNPD